MKRADWQTDNLASRAPARHLPYVLLFQLAVLIGAAPAAADEPISLSAALAEGQVLRYDADATLGLKGAARTESLDQKLRLRFTVAHADKEGAVVRCRLESAQVHLARPDKPAEDFAWKEGDAGAAAGEKEPALNGLYRRLGAAMIELTLDSHGAVKSVSGLDEVVDAGSPARLLGILAPESAARMLQGVFTLDPDGHAHRAGDHWTTTQEFPAGVWIASSSTESELTALAGGVASIRAVSTITPRQPRGDEAATSPRLEIGAQSIKTEADWDTALGRLIKRTTVSEVEVKTTLPLQKPIVSSSTSRSHVVFTRVEGTAGAALPK